MYKLLILFGSITLLIACSGVSRQDMKQLNSITSLNNHVSVKRQRQFVISPASSIGLLVKGSPNQHKPILESFRYHFRHAELVDDVEQVANRYDFVFEIALLKMDIKSTRVAIHAQKVELNKDKVPDSELKPAQNTADNKQKASTTSAKIKPLEVVMSISLVDAVSGQVVDVVLIDAYSSVIRLPKENDFIKDTISRYMYTLTSI